MEGPLEMGSKRTGRFPQLSTQELGMSQEFPPKSSYLQRGRLIAAGASVFVVYSKIRRGFRKAHLLRPFVWMRFHIRAQHHQKRATRSSFLTR